jgi:hypothetical protein
MIRLTTLLLEATSGPTAIFLGGSAGAGKSYFREKFIDPIGDFTVLNIDDEYEPLLKKANLPLDFRKYSSPEQLSIAGTAMSQAQKIHRGKYEKTKAELKNLVIDGTGASSREILKKKQELEDLGYKTMMVIIFVTPDISLFRNLKRGERGGRTLMPSIILKSWSSLFSNLETYKKAFGDNLLLYKAYSDTDIVMKDFDPENPEAKKAFFEPFKIKGKEKSPEEKQKSIEQIKALNATIKQQMQKINSLEFDSPIEIRKKINQVINA